MATCFSCPVAAYYPVHHAASLGDPVVLSHPHADLGFGEVHALDTSFCDNSVSGVGRTYTISLRRSRRRTAPRKAEWRGW
jgi:hypothetical protein